MTSQENKEARMLPSASAMFPSPCESGARLTLVRVQPNSRCRVGRHEIDFDEEGGECLMQFNDPVAGLCALSAHRKRLLLQLSEENAILHEKIKVLEGRDAHQGRTSPRTRMQHYLVEDTDSRTRMPHATQVSFRRTSSCPSIRPPAFREPARSSDTHAVGKGLSLTRHPQAACAERFRTAALLFAEIALRIIDAQGSSQAGIHESRGVAARRRQQDAESLINRIGENVAMLEEEVSDLHRWFSVACEHTCVVAGDASHDDNVLSTAFLDEQARHAPLVEKEAWVDDTDARDPQYVALSVGSAGIVTANILNPITLTCRFAVGVSILVALSMVSVICWLTALTQKKLDFAVWVISLSGLAVSLPVTCYDVFLHIYFPRSKLQVYYVAIMVLAPVYSMQAWLAIRYVSSRKYLTFFRELYECLALYLFLRLLTEFLHKSRVRRFVERENFRQHARLQQIDEQREAGTPMSALKDPRRPSSVEAKLIPSVNAGVFQYIGIRVVFAAACLFLQMVPMQGAIHTSNTRFLDPAHIDAIYFWDAMATNVSQQLAFSMLAVFIAALKRELQPLNPRSKLAGIVVLICSTIWQKWGYCFAVYWGVIVPPVWGYGDPAAFENVMLCLEMALCTFLLRKVFSVRDFLPGGGCHAITSSTVLGWMHSERGAVQQLPSNEGRLCEERARLHSEVLQLQGLVAERIRALEELDDGINSVDDDDDTNDSDVSDENAPRQTPQESAPSFAPSLPRNFSWSSLLSSVTNQTSRFTSEQEDLQEEIQGHSRAIR